jgi:hypothetical protein
MTDQSYAGANDAFHGTLQALQTAQHLSGDGPEAAKLRRGSRELLNYNFVLREPRQRIAQGLRIYPGVARFVWMMSANNRLADIAFHEPKVSDFTDDGLTVPGSSYGMRLRQPLPGIDQIQGAIERLRSEADSRRAAVTIFQPVDALRHSNDIPCAFGMFFHNRGGQLHTTVLMRSNNAFRLLPFNMFEFSLLAEVVAVEAGLAFGPVTYFAGSMHLYDADFDQASAFLEGAAIDQPAMEAMPRDASPLSELTRLGRFEADLRHGSGSLNARTVESWVERATKELTPYWAQLGLILVAGLAAKAGADAFDLAARHVHPDLRSGLPTPVPAVVEQRDFGPLFGGREAPRVVPIFRTELAERFAELAERHERESKAQIGARRLLAAQRSVMDRLAARGESESLTMEVFLKALSDAK